MHMIGEPEDNCLCCEKAKCFGNIVCGNMKKVHKCYARCSFSVFKRSQVGQIYFAVTCYYVDLAKLIGRLSEKITIST